MGHASTSPTFNEREASPWSNNINKLGDKNHESPMGQGT